MLDSKQKRPPGISFCSFRRINVSPKDVIMPYLKFDAASRVVREVFSKLLLIRAPRKVHVHTPPLAKGVIDPPCNSAPNIDGPISTAEEY